MSTIDLVDSEYREAALAIQGFNPERDTLAEMRKQVVASFEWLLPAESVDRKELHIPGVLDEPDVRIILYRPSVQKSARAVILYIHGGGFIGGSPDMCDASSAALAEAHGIPVVAVDYRLAPEAPFPFPLHDCFAALAWLHANPPTLMCDRIPSVAVLGDSAGGGLAVALALLARDRCEKQPEALFLRYPMLDHRTGTEAAPINNPASGEFIWSRAANRFAWQALSGARDIPDQQLAHFSPALAPDLGGLPATFIAVGSLDLFVDENVEFGTRLRRAGVPTELHVYPGGFHGFDLLPGSLSASFSSSLSQAIERWIHR
jgi:acetyl esterase/lipase